MIYKHAVLLFMGANLSFGFAQIADSPKSAFTNSPCNKHYCFFGGSEADSFDKKVVRFFFNLIEDQETEENSNTIHKVSYLLKGNKIVKMVIFFPGIKAPKISSWQQQMLVDTIGEVAGYKTSKENVKRKCYDSVMIANEDTPVLFYQMKTGKKFSVLCSKYAEDGKTIFNVLFLQNWHPKPDPGERQP